MVTSPLDRCDGLVAASEQLLGDPGGRMPTARADLGSLPRPPSLRRHHGRHCRGEHQRDHEPRRVEVGSHGGALRARASHRFQRQFLQIQQPRCQPNEGSGTTFRRSGRVHVCGADNTTEAPSHEEDEATPAGGCASLDVGVRRRGHRTGSRHSRNQRTVASRHASLGVRT